MRIMVSIGATWSQARAARRVRPTTVPTLLRLIAWIASVLPSWPRVRTAVMQLAGFTFIDYAVWRWHALWGYVAIGVSLFVLEALREAPKRGGR